MTCPATQVGVLQVLVYLGGPTTSQDIYGIKFDVLFDPAVLTFTPPAHPGSIWGTVTPPVFEAAVSPWDPGRLVVAISLTGATPGFGSSLPALAILTFYLGASGTGTSPLSLENGQAVDSSLAPIASIQFSATALSVTYK
jgi:hypothetical protein